MACNNDELSGEGQNENRKGFQFQLSGNIPGQINPAGGAKQLQSGQQGGEFKIGQRNVQGQGIYSLDGALIQV